MKAEINMSKVYTTQDELCTMGSLMLCHTSGNPESEQPWKRADYITKSFFGDGIYLGVAKHLVM